MVLFLKKIKLPKLVWYIILGILIGPSLLNIVDDTLLPISPYLRQIAIVIILTRSALSLDINNLKKIGRPAILMCFVHACFEIIGIVIFATLFLGISNLEAVLLGSVLAAVSPAIVPTNLADTVVKNKALRDYLYGINQNQGYDPKVL